MLQRPLHITAKYLSHPGARSLLWSLMLHCLVLGSIELGKLLGLSPLPNALDDWPMQQPTMTDASEVTIEFVPETNPEIFFDADPSTQDLPPEQAMYYAVVDAMGGDPDLAEDHDQPKLDGSQELVPKAADTLQASELASPQNDIPQAESEQEGAESDEQATEVPAHEESQLAPVSKEMIAPSESELDPDGDLPASLEPSEAAPSQRKPRSRPKSLAEARRRQGLIAGEAMEQEGGMKRFRLEASPDLLATPFGAYDAAIIQAIQLRWFSLLEGMPSARSAKGKVLLRFDLMADGNIGNMTVVEDTVGVIQSLICQRAITDPAPYGKWPPDMRRMIGEDRRRIRFTFYYH